MLFEGKRAIGVEFMRNNQLKTVAAEKEVLLSAGTVGSPHILMLSGVGHKEHLKSFGVTLIKTTLLLLFIKYLALLDVNFCKNKQTQANSSQTFGCIWRCTPYITTRRQLRLTCIQCQPKHTFPQVYMLDEDELHGPP